MQAGSRLTLPRGAARGLLTYEDGSVRYPQVFPFEVTGSSARPLERIGYHRLEIADRQVTIAVAPSRCVTIEDRADGKRLWGVAAQIYGLRRAGDGGIGDATAVRELAGSGGAAMAPMRWRSARSTASLLPIPAAMVPYSPSSRLFFNPLFADPDIVFGRERVARYRSDSTAPRSGVSGRLAARRRGQARPAAPAVRRFRGA